MEQEVFRLEAELRAREMGGHLDAEGRFVDEDLAEEIEADAAERA